MLTCSATDLVLPGPREAVQPGAGDPARAIPKMVLGGAGRAIGPPALLVDVERSRLVRRGRVPMRIPDADPLDKPAIHAQKGTPPSLETGGAQEGHDDHAGDDRE